MDLKELLQECKLQLEYLNEKFGETGTTNSLLSKLNTIEDDYTPYCQVCSGCGEEGCCSPLYCEQSQNGKYCSKYLLDLKFGYLMYNSIHSLLKEDDESKNKYNELFDENYDLIYTKNS